MSKIEDALRRARTDRAEGQTAGAAPAQARRDGLPAERRILKERHGGPLVGVSAAEEIARMREDQLRDRDDLAARRIIDKDRSDPRVADAFRHLRTTLFQRAPQKNFVLMVTSVAPEGGSSHVALNLAAAIAFDEGRTALLIDCNLNRPALGNLVYAEEPAGLTDYLAGKESEVAKIIHPIGIPRVRLVPAGGQGRAAMEYFTAPQLSQLLGEFRQRYRERVVIIDAPPISDSADARILAELCDHVLLVVPYGRVTQAQVAAAATAVGPEKLIGCVLNDEQRVPYLRH